MFALAGWRAFAWLEDRFSGPDLAAGTENNDLPGGVPCAENEQLGSEPCDVLGPEITDADDERADQGARFVVGDLGARPHNPIGSDVDADLVGRIAHPRKGLDFDNPAYSNVETSKIVVGRQCFQLSHIGPLIDSSLLSVSLKQGRSRTFRKKGVNGIFRFLGGVHVTTAPSANFDKRLEQIGHIRPLSLQVREQRRHR